MSIHQCPKTGSLGPHEYLVSRSASAQVTVLALLIAVISAILLCSTAAIQHI